MWVYFMINQDVRTFYAAYRKSDKGHYVEVNDDVLKAAGVAAGHTLEALIAQAIERGLVGVF